MTNRTRVISDEAQLLTKERLKYLMANISYFQALKAVNDVKTAVGIGVSRQMFHMYRKFESFPSMETLEKIAKFLDCSVEELLRKDK